MNDLLWLDVLADAACGAAMPIASGSLLVGHCYRTMDGDVVKVVAFDGGRVVYVVERNGICPTWNKAAWRAMLKPDLAQQIEREVICK